MAKKTIAMTTTTSEKIRLNSPTPFTGKRSDFILFMQDVYIYLKVNKATYDNDDKKISFILSYLLGETLLSGNSNLFKQRLKKAKKQRPKNQTGECIKSLWMLSKKPSNHTMSRLRPSKT
jgi:hypothetical protein